MFRWHLLGILVLFINGDYADGLDCTIANDGSSGRVYEYAARDFEVMDFGYDDDPSSIIITLDDSLRPYFYVSGTKLLVSGVKDITRDVSFRSAAVTCMGIDGGNPTTNALIIDVREINSINDVVFEESPYIFTVPEALDVQSEYFEVKATDEDDSTIRYKILEQDPPNYFTFLSSTSNRIVLVKSLDYSLYQQHRLNIQATSTGYNSEGLENSIQTTTTDVFFNVIGEDTLPPQFQPCQDLGEGVCLPPLYTAKVKSNFIGVVNIVPPILAVDGDSAINNGITYSFASGSPDDYDAYFTINLTTGEVIMLSSVSNPDINEFVIAVQATEDVPEGKSAFNYLVVDVIVADNNKPEFVNTPFGGYLLQSAFDNKILSVVTEDKEREIPLKVTAFDADDPQATFAFETTSPFFVSYDGTIYYAPSATQSYETFNVAVKAINLNAELNSPNRVSEVIQLIIETVQDS